MNTHRALQRVGVMQAFLAVCMGMLPSPVRAQEGVPSGAPELRASLAASPAARVEQEVNNEMELQKLREALNRQQREIEQLRGALQRQAEILARVEQSLAADSSVKETPSARMIPAMLELAPAASAAQQAAPAEPPSLERLERTTAELSRSIAGFRFSGDFRFRLDAQLRSANAVAGPLQNIRSRYRLRLNVDKELDRRFAFHMQLSTAPYNNGITNDQDMAGIVAKHPFSIAEVHIDFRPNSRLLLRGGRMSEIFADNMRFLWDDDVRFNGFHQVLTLPLGSGALGFQRLELRSAEYFLSNPNVVIVPANSPFVAAGYRPGQKVRDAMLFHPGFVLSGDPAAGWRHQFTGDVQLYRNPNQIQLASTPEGFPVVVSGALGLALSGPIGGTGNATPAPGAARYFARYFQIARLVYRVERQAVRLWGHQVPAWLDIQVARNLGTTKLRDAFMVSANLGSVSAAGDTRFLYQFAIKDANSLISQFTDDDLGTGTGVNLAVHAVRFDLGLARFLQWQNLVFFQTERRPSNPAERFFVPLQRGANLTYRYLGQLAFSF